MSVGELYEDDDGRWILPFTVVRYSGSGFAGESGKAVMRRTSSGWEIEEFLDPIVWE